MALVGKNVTQWVPLNGKGYVLPTGVCFLVDNSGNFLVDQSGNFLTTTGQDLVPLYPTTWTEQAAS